MKAVYFRGNARPVPSFTAIISTLVLAFALAGCHKAPPPPRNLPPAPPPAPAPTASISANPASIARGGSSLLTWHTSNADDVEIDGMGKVDANGSKSVSPQESSNYRLLAKGAGGEQEAFARITVTGGEETTSGSTGSGVDEASFARSVRDIYFDYDSYEIRSDARRQIESNAAFLARHPGARVTVEGHCDERGSTEFNLALGDSRANAAKQALVQAGTNSSRLSTVSYGKERPVCTESNEECWQQNRRAHFVLQNR